MNRTIKNMKKENIWIEISEYYRLYLYFVYISFGLFIIIDLSIGNGGLPIIQNNKYYLQWGDSYAEISYPIFIYVKFHHAVVLGSWALGLLTLLVICIFAKSKKLVSFKINEDIWFIRKTIDHYSKFEIILLWIARPITLLNETASRQ